MNDSLQMITLEPPQKVVAAVIWLHGLGADGHDFEPIVPSLNLGATHGIRFIFPHAPIRPITINGGMDMRGWYDIDHQGLDRKVDEAGIRASAAAVEALIDAQIADGIPANQIVLAGFSQGGAIAFHLGLRYRKPLAGILALSTYLPLQEALQTERDEGQLKTPIMVAHGTHDPMVPEKNGAAAADHLRQLGYAVDYRTYPMPHAVSEDEISDISAWLKTHLKGALND